MLWTYPSPSRPPTLRWARLACAFTSRSSHRSTPRSSARRPVRQALARPPSVRRRQRLPTEPAPPTVRARLPHSRPADLLCPRLVQLSAPPNIPHPGQFRLLPARIDLKFNSPRPRRLRSRLLLLRTVQVHRQHRLQAIFRLPRSICPAIDAFRFSACSEEFLDILSGWGTLRELPVADWGCGAASLRDPGATPLHSAPHLAQPRGRGPLGGGNRGKMLNLKPPCSMFGADEGVGLRTGLWAKEWLTDSGATPWADNPEPTVRYFSGHCSMWSL